MNPELYLPTWQDVVSISGFTRVTLLCYEAKSAMSFVSSTLDVAVTAHGAIGQFRSDCVTPYIVHPVHVAVLAATWARRMGLPLALIVRIVKGALLHDVIEDTKLRANDLVGLNIPHAVICDVVTLTKAEGEKFEHKPYFEACVLNISTWLVKIADRTSNIMSATVACVPGERNRWCKNYITRTRTEMLAVYETKWPDGISIEQRDYAMAHLYAVLEECEKATGMVA